MQGNFDNFECVNFRGRSFWILRDDKIGGEFNGNKARKLEYFLNSDLSGFKRIISYGSNQSNAMYSLSVFAKMKELEFIYVTDHLSGFLKERPSGNLALALRNGMVIYESKNRADFASNLKNIDDILIPEGVAMSEAEYGFKTQAKLIEDFSNQIGFKFDIFLPSGTGASAAYLAKNLSQMKVYTTPCVGDRDYLASMVLNLDKDSKLNILNPPKKYHFGNLKRELFDIYKELKDSTNVEFELLYDSVGWLSLLYNLTEFKNKILYIHQGGIIGNESLLERYKRKFKLDMV
ncbi:1-aminocyclopropane-1-carboxylate deaminase [Campylobacter fetus]|uniref:1-aminocyclopropane-1-carboxylate deaminase n=1 Tax=Campylobacter fetus TaxID=196 RepID=A0A5L8VA51_CAMFE|nr:1-aminocyclopropane-1-carboxylate deaminase [Campylobacter fetus]EAI4415372.1 1-aminocyclopropane-1-carboxylate deaminase [Campylobacter fetus]EAI5408093.1 1-aminocyclopropane-1-carboxylate deaminase [Campylobacter fetus]EAJ0327430.1 1-aminocyclopropane-1-carboxylate deaminase [Campylobacter fetus]EAJ1230929.1 1-aminocyclopropane-1-carboxylate deaminase [Campylobacter fetus]EAK0416355.1 1-aminocyclopropane-1-carboxylate deaminase [Campylobacter fetus]